MPEPTLKELANLPVRITNSGIFIGDQEIKQPVIRGGMKVEPVMKRHNLLTLTFVVGEVVIDGFPVNQEVEPDAES